jgi:hypothetical protein
LGREVSKVEAKRKGQGRRYYLFCQKVLPLLPDNTVEPSGLKSTMVEEDCVLNMG